MTITFVKFLIWIGMKLRNRNIDFQVKKIVSIMYGRGGTESVIFKFQSVNAKDAGHDWKR